MLPYHYRQIYSARLSFKSIPRFDLYQRTFVATFLRPFLNNSRPNRVPTAFYDNIPFLNSLDMATRQVLFALLACVGFGYAIKLPAPPAFTACEGKAADSPCKVTLTGVEVDGICDLIDFGVG
jgi:hypothetical protein